VTLLQAIRNEERRRAKLGKLQRKLDGIRAAAKALGRSAIQEGRTTKRRVLSAAGRARIAAAARRRWAKVRASARRSPAKSSAATHASRVSKIHFSDYGGDLKGSTQHSSRTRLALKTKGKSLARVRSAGTLPWLGFDRKQPNRSVLPGKHYRINVLEGVASTA